MHCNSKVRARDRERKWTIERLSIRKFLRRLPYYYYCLYMIIAIDNIPNCTYLLNWMRMFVCACAAALRVVKTAIFRVNDKREEEKYIWSNEIGRQDSNSSENNNRNAENETFSWTWRQGYKESNDNEIFASFRLRHKYCLPEKTHWRVNFFHVSFSFFSFRS